MFAIGLVLFLLGAGIFATDRRDLLTQRFGGLRKVDYLAGVLVAVGVNLVIASLVVWAWRTLP